MDTKEEGKEEGKGCCSKGSCCGGKVAAVLALLLAGGAGGFLAARHCGKSCPVAPAAAPAQPK